MVKAFVCEACGGRQAEKNQTGLLACAYCGSTHLLVAEESGSKPLAVRKLGWLLLLLVVVIVMWQREPFKEVNGGPTDSEPVTAKKITHTESVPPPKTTPVAFEKAPSTTTERKSLPLSVLSEHKNETTSGGVYWVFQVKNHSDQTLYRPRVVVSLFDDKDERVAEQTGWAQRPVLPAGESDVVMVYLQKSGPDASRQQVQAHGDTSTFLVPNKLLLPVTQYKVNQQRSRYELVGDVHNPHEHMVRFVKVVAVAMNADDQPVGVANAYATQKELGPGETSGFKITAGTFMTEPPVTWSLSAIASIKPQNQP